MSTTFIAHVRDSPVVEATFGRPSLFDRTTDRLFRNITFSSTDKTVQFEDVSAELNILDGLSAGLGVTALDCNSDGWLDIYVASDQHPNLLWLNNQGEFFTEHASAIGLDLDFAGRAQASMGLALAHVGSGNVEGVVVSHLENEANAVYSPAAEGFYTDASRESGLAAQTRPLTGFGLAEIDFGLDGIPEILMASGHVRRPEKVNSQISRQFWNDYRQPLQISNVSTDHSTPKVNTPIHSSMHLVGRGLASGDLDGDGDCDAVVSTVGQRAVILRNDSQREGRCVWLRPVDPKLAGRSCTGAILSYKIGEIEYQRTFQPCQSYASTHVDALSVSVPFDVNELVVTVRWPHGDWASERFDLSVSGAIIELRRGYGATEK